MDTTGNIKLSEVIHFYIGCQVIADGKEQGTLMGGDFVPNSIGQIYYAIQTPEMKEDDETIMPYNDSYEGELRIKPILRPLSDMKEEDMIGLLQSMVPPDMEDKPTDDDYSLEMFYNDGGNMVDGDVAVGANVSCICWEAQIAIRQTGDIDLYDEGGERDRVVNQPAAFRYLLSKGFDLFNLIESNQAIDATITSTP